MRGRAEGAGKKGIKEMEEMTISLLVSVFHISNNGYKGTPTYQCDGQVCISACIE